MLGLIFFIVFSFVAAEESSPYLTDKNRNELFNNAVAQTLLKTHVKNNTPYIEKDENLVRLPTITARNEAHKKKKKQKKAPKRTVQKIIKKNKSKSKVRKIYYQRTNKPTTNMDFDKFYGSEDQHYERTTTQTQNQRKRARKFSNKVARYHLPFQNSQMKMNHRYKRDWSRELNILKKLDMKKDKDYDMDNIPPNNN